MTYLHGSTECSEYHGLVRDFGGERPKIVTLCGSTRFRDDFDEVNAEMTLQGCMVFAPGVWVRSSPAFADLPVDEAATIKVGLDELHKRKIDAADRVYVVNPGGYIGDSTRSEIAYAEKLGKPISYLVEPEASAA